MQDDFIGIPHHEPQIWIPLFQLHQSGRGRHLRPALRILCHTFRNDTGSLFIGALQPWINDPDPANEEDDKEDEQECLQGEKALHQRPSQGSVSFFLHVFNRMR